LSRDKAIEETSPISSAVNLTLYVAVSCDVEKVMRILTFPQLKAKGIPYCREQVRRKAKAGEFPAPISLSDRRIAWIECEIDAWIEQCVALRDQPKAA